MNVIQKTEHNTLANVFVAEDENGRRVEFVESTQPPLKRNEKWVLIISTLFGCPVGCSFCDAGGAYHGKLSFDQLKFQVDYLVETCFGDKNIDTGKFKIQFSRMGEPSLNHHVIDFLERIPGLYSYRHFIPSLSTVAPAGTELFFHRLLKTKKTLFDNTFQLQFSVHSTDPRQRRELIPVRSWSYEEMAAYGRTFYTPGGKKITLNFALGEKSMVDPAVLLRIFDPDTFLVKLTPVNPTHRARKNKINSVISTEHPHIPLVDQLQEAGYEVIVSIGEWEENKIGSNCGQYVNCPDEAYDSESYTCRLVRT